MSRQAFESAKELALEHSEAERAELASTLVASLDGPVDADVEAEWESEILRRLDEIDHGKAKFVKADDALDRIVKRLRKI